METVCRLCVSKPESYVDVFDNEGKSLNLVKKIAQCLQIWLHPEDSLPKTICAQCVQKLNDTFLFFETCSKAQATLQLLFGVSVVNTSQETNSSPADAPVANGDDEGTPIKTEPGLKMEPGLNALASLVQDRNERRLALAADLDIAVELKSTNLPEHPEDLLECLLENPENAAMAAASIANMKNLPVNPNNGHEPSVKRKGRPPSKPAASAKQSKEDSSVKAKGKPSKKPTPSPTPLEDSASEESENEEDLPMEPKKDGDKESSLADWLDEGSASETESLIKKGAKKTAPASKKTASRILEDYPWQCVLCDAMVNSLSDLKSHHENEHGQAPVFKCMQCSKVYNRYRSFSRHVKLHHNPKKFSCDICGKSFAQKTVLQSHSAVHSDERPFCCDQCGKRFKQFSSLYLHNKNHLPSEEREKFRCEHCDKEFASKHTLETHRKVHTGERNFICDICGKSFIAKGSLDYHILSHTGDKPHDCSVCGKGFKTARLLAKHVTLHSGIKPHQCDVCGKQFREKGALREHSRIHTGAMPYACDYCGKRFRFKGILTVHTRQHTGERPYSCLDCPRHFTNWANYNKHMKRRHRNADGGEVTCPDTGRRTFQSHPQPPPPPPSSGLAPGLVPALAVPTSSSSALILEVPSYTGNSLSPGLPPGLPPNMALLDSSGSALMMPSHEMQGGKMLPHGNLPHLGHDLHPGHTGLNLLASFGSDRLAKNEEGEGDDSSEDDDDDGVPGHESGPNHNAGQTLGALADAMEEPLSDERLAEGPHAANDLLPRHLYLQDNSNSSSSMTVSSAFPSNYSNNSPTKMAVMFQPHHNNKMASMFYQDGVCDSASQSNLSMNMGTYHMNPYMSSASALPAGLTAVGAMGAMGSMGSMGSMGYYIQPIHGDHSANAHQPHNLHVSHNRVSHDQ